jgi:glycerol kinase
MRSAGVVLKDVRVSGGLSRLSYLMQFQADILGVPLHRCDGGEATAMGAAWLAARQAGVAWADRLSTPRVDKIFKPQMQPKQSEALRLQWTRFVDAQAALSRDF